MHPSRASRLDLAIRSVALLGILASFVLIAAVLLLSDRAGGLGVRVKTFILDVGEAFEDAFGVDWLDRDSIPGTFDQIGHAVLWGGGMFLIGLTFRRWVHPIVTALAIGVLSAVFEYLQAVLTVSRTPQVTDVVANASGILIALVLVLIIGMVLDSVITPFREWRSRGA